MNILFILHQLSVHSKTSQNSNWVWLSCIFSQNLIKKFTAIYMHYHKFISYKIDIHGPKSNPTNSNLMIYNIFCLYILVLNKHMYFLYWNNKLERPTVNAMLIWFYPMY